MRSITKAASAIAMNDTMTAEAYDPVFVGRFRAEPIR
jgi:hypothetical protein